jgi:hypothetical protein
MPYVYKIVYHLVENSCDVIMLNPGSVSEALKIKLILTRCPLKTHACGVEWSTGQRYN